MTQKILTLTPRWPSIYEEVPHHDKYPTVLHALEEGWVLMSAPVQVSEHQWQFWLTKPNDEEMIPKKDAHLHCPNCQA